MISRQGTLFSGVWMSGFPTPFEEMSFLRLASCGRSLTVCVCQSVLCAVFLAPLCPLGPSVCLYASTAVFFLVLSFKIFFLVVIFSAHSLLAPLNPLIFYLTFSSLFLL